MADGNDILAALLRVQSEIREIEKDELSYSFEDQSRTQHSAVRETTFSSVEAEAIYPTSSASISQGTDLVITPTNEAQDVAWADFWRNAQTPEFGKANCANGTNCFDDNFCYSWFDCGPCQTCENSQCVEKDPNAYCQEDWECPCPPNDDQFYSCSDNKCVLTCKSNSDCGDCEVCDPTSFTCQPGCASDAQCNPLNSGRAPDARAGTYCIDCECVTPCEPSVLCDGPDDINTCGQGQYCAEKIERASTDPSFESRPFLYECVYGCKEDSQCEIEVTEISNDDGSITRYERQPVCLDNSCVNACSRNSDCISALDEFCVEGECRSLGKPCLGDSSCPDGEYCSDGHCKSGCSSSSDCFETCEKESSCVDACPPEPTCTCTDFFTAEACLSFPEEEWQKFCERDAACIASCPDDPKCVAANARNLQCIGNTCKMACPCPEGYICTGGECIAISNEPEVVCVETTTCETINDQGDQECVTTEKCESIPPYSGGGELPVCDCSETCGSDGQCVPAVCRYDSDCPSCSYCSEGVCIPGCDDENPCGSGQCCQPDGRCHDLCKDSSDCPGLESCLGGCCGTACQQELICVSSDNCPDGWSCGVAGICEKGCVRDEDCPSGICVDDGDDVKTCVEPCVSDSDCGSGFYCWESTFCRADILPCQNDGDCPEVLNEYGERVPQVCLDGSCQYGCRSDEECGQSSLCVDNVCEYICTTDEECGGLGFGDRCESNLDAKRKASRYYSRLRKSGGGTVQEFARWGLLADSSDTGYCVTVEYDEEGEEITLRACENYESCSENGDCERLPCIGDVDCPDGSCLSDGQCGLCTQDEDCLEGQVCQPDGICAVPCIPQKECEADSDCPKGSYCSEDLYYDRGRQPKRFCAEGCRDEVFCESNSDCPSLEGLYGAEPTGLTCGSGLGCPEGEVCRGNVCSYPLNVCDEGKCRYNGGECGPGKACRDNACLDSCDSTSDCPVEVLTNPDGSQEEYSSFQCLSGACVNVGFQCLGDSDCPAHLGLGHCSNGVCVEDLRCSDDDDCFGSEVCHGGQCRSGDFCRGNSDCPDGQVCGGFNTCVTGTKCGSGYPPCQFPNICFDGECIPSESCDQNNPCADAFKYCDRGQCVPDLRCDKNEDCLEGFFCNRSGLCQEKSDKPRQPQTIGCSDDCLFFCGPQFTCEPITCDSDNDCPCGSCIQETGLCSTACESNTDCPAGQRCSNGKCQPCQACEFDAQCPDGIECKEGCCDMLPSCRNDGDCDPGICLKGECVECRQDGDCAANYGSSDLVCVENKCETPCYTGLSDGSCFDGLKAGDTCSNCPGQCPVGYTCSQDGRVCGTYEVLNTVTNEAETRFVMCETCLRPCSGDEMCKQACITSDDCKQIEPSLNFCIPGAVDNDCAAGEICSNDNQCVWPTPTCNSGVCEGEKLIQESLCGDPSPSGLRVCEQFDGKCDTDFDCNRLTALDGVNRVCSDFSCIEAEVCLGNDDCEDLEICVSGLCRPGNCSVDADCNDPGETGRVCGSNNMCTYPCGPTAEAYACAAPDGPYDAGIPCPPGYDCNTTTNLCTRPGYDGIGQFMLGCQSGEFCLGGSCEPCSGQAGNGNEYDESLQYECRANSCCDDKELCDTQGRTMMVCKAGQCEEVFKPSYQAFPGEEVPKCEDTEDIPETQSDSENRTDICSLKGDCCDDRGFCAACACDENNPCGSRYVMDGGSLVEKLQCCDSQTNTCVDIDRHPLTAYGAPGECSLGQVFCEVLGPEGEGEEERTTIDVTSFSSDEYEGCQTVTLENGEESQICAPGLPLSPVQIATILGQQCNPPKIKEECECSVEIPATDECLADGDCPGEQSCVSKTFRGDACCPVADAEGNNYVVRNVCKGRVGNGECSSDSDCTECEYCSGYVEGTPDREAQMGYCQEDCSRRCPDGGELTAEGLRCKTCEEQYGPCVEGLVVETTPASFNPDTGELTEAITSTTCRVKTELNCCEGLSNLEEARTSRDGCLVKQVNVNGKLTYAQVDFCADFENDVCAECTADTHCEGPNSKCKNNVCITDCGSENSLGSDYAAACTCCTSEGECKQLFEDWSEVREGTPAEDGTQSFQTRPCACTESGIDCAEWGESESCFKWVRREDSNDLTSNDPNSNIAAAEALPTPEEQKSERDRIESQLNELAAAQGDLDIAKAEGNIALSEAAATLEQARVDADILCGSTEACESDKEGYDLVQDELSDWGDRLSDLSLITTDLAVELSDAESLVAAAQTLVAISCPSDTLCPIETEKLAKAEEALRILRDETIPAHEALVQEAEDGESQAFDDLDYWIDRAVLSCGYEPYTTESTSQQCREALEDLQPLDVAYQSALTAAQAASTAAENNRTAVLELQRQLQETTYRPAAWVQERACECCVDGQCRPESDCIAGTCYLCQREPEGRYQVKLYTLVDDTPVCSGCSSIAGEPADNAPYCPDDVGGPTSTEFVTANECVKYRCEDGIKTHFEPCDAYQNTWYDVCVGSIVGCVLGSAAFDSDPNTARYWNGYEYDIRCPVAGTWAYNDKSVPDGTGNTRAFSDWVRLTQPKERDIFSSCGYPNPLAGSGGNWLNEIAGLRKIHPCCADAVTYYECDPETPNCEIKFDVIFDGGASNALLDRLKLEKEALIRHRDDLESARDIVDNYSANSTALSQQLERELEELRNSTAVSAIEQQISTLEASIDSDRLALEVIRGEVDQLEDDFEDALDDVQDVIQDQADLGSDKQALVDQRDLKVADRQQAISDGEAAKAEWSTASATIDSLTISIPVDEEELVLNQCACPFVDGENGDRVQQCPDGVTEAANATTIECVQALIDLDNDRQTLVDLQGQIGDLSTTYQDFFATADELKVEIDDLNSQIDTLTTSINNLFSDIQNAQLQASDVDIDLTAKRNEFIQLANSINTDEQLLKSLNDNLADTTKTESDQIEILTTQIEDALDMVDIYNDLSISLLNDYNEFDLAVTEKQTEIDTVSNALGADDARPVASVRPDTGSTLEEIQGDIAAVIAEQQEAEANPWFPEG